MHPNIIPAKAYSNTAWCYFSHRKNIPWICVQNPSAKEIDGDLMKAFQSWYELQGSQVRITAERVKGQWCVVLYS